MATQDASGIDFSIAPEAQQQHFRLLELPPELLELLTSENAPTLHLKSGDYVPGRAAEQGAVLCTPDKTYNLRQVNTSNSLFVTYASAGPSDEIPRPRVDAIAQSHFTLELQAAKDVSAGRHIQAILPVYASTGHYQSKTPISKSTLFSNISASDAECEQAWADLACFELDGEALIPSASVMVKVWESILSTATAESIDLTATLDDGEFSTLTDPNSSQWPREVVFAVLRSMSHLQDQAELRLDEKKCATAVGQALLKDRAEHAAVPKTAFIATWTDILPEKWRSSAELSLLQGSYKLEGGNISFNNGESDGVQAMAAGAKAPAEAKSALGAKRKWHEKFRASKKTV